MNAKRAQEGFLKSYDAYSADLLRHAIVRTNDEDAAKDLVSETFLRAWEFVSREKSRNMRALLYKILGNLLTDHYRRKARPIVSLEDLPETLEPTDPVDIQTELASRFAAETARGYLALLPKDHRDIFNYRFMDDLSAKEIKEITGKSVANIYVILHRGLKILRQKLDPHEK